MYRRQYPVVDEKERKETLEILEYKLKKNEIERKEEIEKLKEMEKLKQKGEINDRMLYDIMRYISFMKSVKREILKNIRKNMTKQEKKEKKMKKQKEIQEKKIIQDNKFGDEIHEIEMEKDEPIYFLCRPNPRDDSASSMLWYVIEDNENDHIPKNENVEFTVEVVCVSKTDRIRALCLPPPPPFLSDPIYNTTIALFNSYLYLLGGCGSIVGVHNTVRFTDILHKEDGWCFGSLFPSITPQQVINMAATNNGSIIVKTIDSSYEKHLLWLSSLSSNWEKLPEPSNTKLSYYSATILALTNTHLFTIMSSNQSKCGVIFSFAKWKWCVFDRISFQGRWTEGVVFYDNYLVTYGTSTSRSLKKRPSLHVYDLKARKWLPHHLSKYKNAFPPHKSSQQPHLFQVGPNKLAVIWQQVVRDSIVSPTRFYDVHCTKFIIHKTSRINQPPVYAKVFSHGTYRFAGHMVSCVARKNVEDIDKRTLVKSRNEILEMVAKDSWLSLP